MVGRKKGTPKTGGRTKGTPNKVTESVKGWISKVIDSNRDKFERDLNSLEPSERVRIISGLLQYVTPKMQSINPAEILEAEYERFERLLDDCPDEVVDKLFQKMEELRNGQEE
jgi:hypothetical protein